MLFAETLERDYLYLVNDKRLSVWLISIYMTLILLWHKNELSNPFPISRKKIMELAHVHSFATYHKCIGQLEMYGYIRYNPSFNYYRRFSIFINVVNK